MADNSLSDKLDLPAAICCACDKGSFPLALHLHNLLDTSANMPSDYWKDRAVIGAVKSGDIDNVKFVIENGYYYLEYEHNALVEGISGGKIEIYELLKTLEPTSTPTSIGRALKDLYRNGHLAMIQHLKHVIPNPLRYLYDACQYDHMDIIQYHLKDSPIVPQSIVQQCYDVSAKHNHLHIMEYLYSHGYAPHTSLLLASTYNIHTLRFLKNIGRLEFTTAINLDRYISINSLERLEFLWIEYKYKNWFNNKLLNWCVKDSMLSEAQFIMEETGKLRLMALDRGFFKE
eukprot:gene3853-4451_t